MSLQETHIYISCPIGDLVNRLADRLVEQLSVGSDYDVIYCIRGSDGEAGFGLIADLDAPSGRNWTQLLHPAPHDRDSVAKALHAMSVSADMLESATDWDRNCLVALEPIITVLRDFEENGSAAQRDRRLEPLQTAFQQHIRTETPEKHAPPMSVEHPKQFGMKTGTVKFYNDQKGFGFIAPDDGTRDVFVPATALERAGMRGLAQGQKVTFETAEDILAGKIAVSKIRMAG